MFCYLCDKRDEVEVNIPADTEELLDELEQQINDAKLQLKSDNWSRIVLYADIPTEGEESYNYLEIIHGITARYYDEAYVVGDTTSCKDLRTSFEKDNLLISVLSIVFVISVLLFTFKSAGMPVLLILVIQGCIWINFSVPAVTGKYLFYLSYLIVSSIQMGANIDYAIVIASRYQELKAKMAQRSAIVETLNFAFPTIITSGAIMSICGFLIGSMTSEPVIAGIGESLGRGTVISMFLVMFVLPQILLIGSGIVDKTSFSVPSISEKKSGHGKISVNGMVRGNINGTVHGIMHATVEGDIDLTMLSGAEGEEVPDDEEED